MSTRKIRKKIQPPAVNKTYEQIKAKDLNVDPELQRAEDQSLIKMLEDRWNPAEVGTLVANKRSNGTYWLCDGQHRRKVAELLEGSDFVFTVEVHHGLTRQQEAAKYLTINRHRKAPRPYDNYKVALAAREPLEVKIDRELTAWGLEAAHSPSVNKISAVETLRRLAARDKVGGLIQDTLGVAIQAWGKQPSTYDGMIIEGLGRIIDANRGTIDYKRLATILGRKPAPMWRQSAMMRTVGGGGSESRSNALANVIADAYNNGLRTDSKMIKNIASRKR